MRRAGFRLCAEQRRRCAAHSLNKHLVCWTVGWLRYTRCKGARGLQVWMVIITVDAEPRNQKGAAGHMTMANNNPQSHMLRSYHSEQTRSHQNSEVNLNWAASVLRTEMTWEPAVSNCFKPKLAGGKGGKGGGGKGGQRGARGPLRTPCCRVASRLSLQIFSVKQGRVSGRSHSSGVQVALPATRRKINHVNRTCCQ